LGDGDPLLAVPAELAIGRDLPGRRTRVRAHHATRVVLTEYGYAK